ncbi:hypothetical protein BDV39DRAFT_169607 [Aspergillus sergii]|uniref:Uncharacterized protein n=1 Tax=Aspergillus sergii TaxID=1034303 RepID=A0A5N6XFN7_9EURO|nr:hypothetical protein BDV39DRAFT_169607 [Aspergillus sergii]
MKSEPPDHPNTSRKIWTRRANEEFVVSMVSMFIAMELEGLAFGYERSGKSESYTYWCLRMFIMGFINWLGQVLYKRYRGL